MPTPFTLTTKHPDEGKIGQVLGGGSLLFFKKLRYFSFLLRMHSFSQLLWVSQLIILKSTF